MKEIYRPEVTLYGWQDAKIHLLSNRLLLLLLLFLLLATCIIIINKAYKYSYATSTGLANDIMWPFCWLMTVLCRQLACIW